MILLLGGGLGREQARLETLTRAVQTDRRRLGLRLGRGRLRFAIAAMNTSREHQHENYFQLPHRSSAMREFNTTGSGGEENCRAHGHTPALGLSVLPSDSQCG